MNIYGKNVQVQFKVAYVLLQRLHRQPGLSHPKELVKVSKLILDTVRKKREKRIIRGSEDFVRNGRKGLMERKIREEEEVVR